MPELLKLILALVFPPAAVFLEVGVTFHLFLNIVLTILGYVPGMLHALWVVFTFR